MLLNVNTLDFHYDIIWIRHSCPTGTINPHPTNGSREKKRTEKFIPFFSQVLLPRKTIHDVKMSLLPMTL